MTIDVSQTIPNYDGTPMYDESDAPLTIRAMMLFALNQLAPQEQQTGEQKAKLYALSVKLANAEQVDLDLAERALIKERAEKTLRPVTLGPVLAVLQDPPETPKE